MAAPNNGATSARTAGEPPHHHAPIARPVSADDSLDKYLPKALQKAAAAQAKAVGAAGASGAGAGLPPAAGGAATTGQGGGVSPGRPQASAPPILPATETGRQQQPMQPTPVSVSQWIAGLTPQQQHELQQSGLLERVEDGGGGLPPGSGPGAEKQPVGARAGVPGLGLSPPPSRPTTVPKPASAEESFAQFVVPSASGRRGEWSGGTGVRKSRSVSDAGEDAGFPSSGQSLPLPPTAAAFDPLTRRPSYVQQAAREDMPRRRRTGAELEAERKAWDNRHGGSGAGQALGSAGPGAGVAGQQQATGPVSSGTADVRTLLTSHGTADQSTAEFLARLGSAGRVGLEPGSSAPAPAAGAPAAGQGEGQGLPPRRPRDLRPPSEGPNAANPYASSSPEQGGHGGSGGAPGGGGMVGTTTSSSSGWQGTLSDRAASSPVTDGVPPTFKDRGLG